MGSDVPGPEDALMLEPGMFCEEHTEMIEQWSIPYLNFMLAAQGKLLSVPAFYDVAYRKKNGYDRPEGVERDDVPESERPGNIHINAAMQEIEPLCCWLEENVEDPYPDQDTTPLLGIIAKFAAEEWGDEDGDAHGE